MLAFYKGKQRQAYVSHVKVQITASRRDIFLVLDYGITEHPMMLATNKELKSMYMSIESDPPKKLNFMFHQFPGARAISKCHLTKLTNLLATASKGRYGKEKAMEIRNGRERA